MFPVLDFFPTESQGDPLSNYERSRLGRWTIAKEIESDDSVFGIQLKTPAGPIRIRFETTVNGKSFRAAREQTIDELLAIAKGDDVKAAVPEAVPPEAAAPEIAPEAVPPEEVPNKVEPEKAAVAKDNNKEGETEADKTEESTNEEPQNAEATEPEVEFVAPGPYFSPSIKQRMIAYAKSRGDRLTRHELRRRVADIAGGPSSVANDERFWLAATRNHDAVCILGHQRRRSLSLHKKETLLPSR